ncbi:hypothetical protein [Microbulbifer donghaiensis]|uniref:hypothetical protein n=1 Tax=Microbulbifer donghaiensis TaxID=494016 RepID=UPI000934C088|nr:hypothetical protein [Microbulbifer donghaiensis]
MPGLLLFSALLSLLASLPAGALGRFAGGGAHFNIGGHFNAIRPIGGGGFRPDFRGGDFQRRFPNAHPFENHPLQPYRHRYPRYWPYAGPGYWAGAAAGAAAVAGAWVYSLPADCTRVSVGGITYEHCGPEWYRPHYTGTQIAYEVVAAPR